MLRALDFRERTRLRRLIYAKPTILAVVALSVLTLHGAWGMWQKSHEAIANRDEAIAKEEELKAHERELRADITKLSSDRGQEEEIRNRFMVAKDGEKVIIVSRPDDAVSHSVTVESPEAAENLVDRLRAAVGLSGD